MVKRITPPPSKPDPRASALWVPIDSVTLDPHNARERTPRNSEVIRKSLDKFGQRKPIVVDADGIVIAGNGTWQAAKALGWSEIWVAPSALRGAEARAFAIADNRAGDLSQFDELELTLAIEGLDGDLLDVIGFDAVELAELLPIPEHEKTDDEKPAAKKSQGQVTPGRIVLRLMVAMQSVALFERALTSTGVANRETAINMVARAYLEGKGQLE